MEGNGGPLLRLLSSLEHSVRLAKSSSRSVFREVAEISHNDIDWLIEKPSSKSNVSMLPDSSLGVLPSDSEHELTFALIIVVSCFGRNTLTGERPEVPVSGLSGKCDWCNEINWYCRSEMQI